MPFTEITNCHCYLCFLSTPFRCILFQITTLKLYSGLLTKFVHTASALLINVPPKRTQRAEMKMPFSNLPPQMLQCKTKWMIYSCSFAFGFIIEEPEETLAFSANN